MHRNSLLPTLSVFLLVASASGCRQQPTQASPPGPPVVPVARPVERKVTDYVDYTGRIAAVNAVDIRPRVTGYLVNIPFKEGAEVKKGDLLFEIDPRPYQAQLDQAQGQLRLAQARARQAVADYARARRLAETVQGGISQQDLESYAAAEAEAKGSAEVARAGVTAAKLNLDFCRVTSPIDGRVSRYYLTLGNLVNADQTLLTTVISEDPVYAYFDMDERTVLQIRNAINAGKIIPHKNVTDIPVLMALEGEQDFPHHGTLNFINNQVNPSTGTMAVRGVFANPIPGGDPARARRLMTPGMFVRIRLPIGQPHSALLVIDRAIGSDQGRKFVYVVNGQNQVEYRPVTTGSLEDDGLRVLEPGSITKEDWVVVGALQQVRPRTTVEPERLEEMPTMGPTGGQQAPPPVPPRPQRPPAAGNNRQRQPDNNRR